MRTTLVRAALCNVYGHFVLATAHLCVIACAWRIASCRSRANQHLILVIAETLRASLRREVEALVLQTEVVTHCQAHILTARVLLVRHWLHQLGTAIIYVAICDALPSGQATIVA